MRFIPWVDMTKDADGTRVERPKSERQARGGVSFVIKILFCHPSEDEINTGTIGERHSMGGANLPLSCPHE